MSPNGCVHQFVNAVRILAPEMYGKDNLNKWLSLVAILEIGLVRMDKAAQLTLLIGRMMRRIQLRHIDNVMRIDSNQKRNIILHNINLFTMISLEKVDTNSFSN